MRVWDGVGKGTGLWHPKKKAPNGTATVLPPVFLHFHTITGKLSAYSTEIVHFYKIVRIYTIGE